MEINKKQKYFFKSYLKHDLKASITVFFVALPLCLGVALASGAPLVSGIIAGIIGGIVVSLISGSQLSVSGPAAGLTAICTTAITDLGTLDVFFVSVAAAGIIQIILGVLKLGGFTHFIPSAVIKGMLAAIGIILITKQIPLLLGYEKPDFYTDEFVNVFTLHTGFDHAEGFFPNINEGAILISIFAIVFIFLWDKYIAKKISFLPSSFVLVLAGVGMAQLLPKIAPFLALEPGHFVQLPDNILAEIKLPDFAKAFGMAGVWKFAVVIAFVATLESLLSAEAVDKLDPQKRITPPNRELIAQGSGNFLSGLLGGIPITAVIVRSSANTMAGARSKWSSFTHGIWLLLTVLFAVSLIRLIPYAVLAVILLRTGYNLAKPALFKAVYKQGREQFLPFIVTVSAIMVTDLLIGVVIGTAYAIYFLIKYTYKAGYSVEKTSKGHHAHYRIELALNVTFLNKKRFRDMLYEIPAYSTVEIVGTKSVYVDHDILEIFQEFKHRAHEKHIDFTMQDVAEVSLTNFH